MYIDNFETRMSRVLRQYPILAVVGLGMVIVLLAIVGEPVLAFVGNWFQRISYHNAFRGAEGSALAQETWKELVSELNAIGEMGKVGKLLMSMPSIVRVLTVFMTALVAFGGCYFVAIIWEVMLDNHIWDMLAKCICIIGKALLLVVAIIGWSFWEAGKRIFREALRIVCTILCYVHDQYLEWKNSQYQAKYLTR